MSNSENFLDIWLNLKNSFRLKNNTVSKNIEENSITFVASRNSKISIQFEKFDLNAFILKLESSLFRNPYR